MSYMSFSQSQSPKKKEVSKRFMLCQAKGRISSPPEFTSASNHACSHLLQEWWSQLTSRPLWCRLFPVRTFWTWDQNVPLWEKFVRQLNRNLFSVFQHGLFSLCLESGVLSNQRKHFLFPRVTARLNLSQILKIVQSLLEPYRCPQYLFLLFPL